MKKKQEKSNMEHFCRKKSFSFRITVILKIGNLAQNVIHVQHVTNIGNIFAREMRIYLTRSVDRFNPRNESFSLTRPSMICGASCARCGLFTIGTDCVVGMARPRSIIAG